MNSWVIKAWTLCVHLLRSRSEHVFFLQTFWKLSDSMTDAAHDAKRVRDDPVLTDRMRAETTEEWPLPLNSHARL